MGERERIKIEREKERDRGENTEKCLFSEMHGFMPFSMMHIFILFFVCNPRWCRDAAMEDKLIFPPIM